MEFEEFSKNIRRVSSTRKHKITNSVGVYDAYKYYRKNRPKDNKYVLTESKFFALIRAIHKRMCSDLIKGYDVLFPSGMGSIELRKYCIEPRLNEEGKLIYKAPIDWNKTIKYWYENEDAFKNKILLRVDTREYFKVVYNKSKTKFKNKSYFTIHLNRKLRKSINEELSNGKLDAFSTKYK